MTTLTRLALAAALSAATFVPTITTADAGGKDWHHKHHYYGNGWSPGSAFLAGTVIGLGFGAYASPYYYPSAPPVYYYPPAPPPPPYADYSDEAHIDWCSRTYRSYNAEDDTWIDYAGVMHQCVGPY